MLSGAEISSVIRNRIEAACQSVPEEAQGNCARQVSAKTAEAVDLLCDKTAQHHDIYAEDCRELLSGFLWRNTEAIDQEIIRSGQEELHPVIDVLRGFPLETTRGRPFTGLTAFIDAEAEDFKSTLPPPSPPVPQPQPEKRRPRRKREPEPPDAGRPDQGVVKVQMPDADRPDLKPARPQEPDAGAETSAGAQQTAAPSPPPEDKNPLDILKILTPKQWAMVGAGGVAGMLAFWGIGHFYFRFRNRPGAPEPLHPSGYPRLGEPAFVTESRRPKRASETPFGEKRTVLAPIVPDETPTPPPPAGPPRIGNVEALVTQIEVLAVKNLSRIVSPDVSNIIAQLILDDRVWRASLGSDSSLDTAKKLLIRADVLAESESPGTGTITAETVGRALREMFKGKIDEAVLNGILAKAGITLPLRVSPAPGGPSEPTFPPMLVEEFGGGEQTIIRNAVYVRVGAIQVDGNPEVVARQIRDLGQPDDARLAKRILAEFLALPEAEQEEWVQREYERDPAFDPKRQEQLPVDFVKNRLEMIQRENIGVAERKPPEEPKGPKGKGPGEPPSAPKPPAAAAKGGEAPKGDGQFVDPFADDPDFLLERKAATLEKYGGFFNITLILGAIETAEHFGWIGEKQYKMTHDGVTAAFFIADAGFLAAMAAGWPGAEVGGGLASTAADKTGIPWLKRGTLGNKYVGLGGGLAGFTASLKAAGRFAKYREFHAATAAGTRHAVQSAAQVVGRTGAAIEGGLTSAWQGFATGLRMYGKEVAAVASGYAAAAQMGARVLLNAGARFATPIFIIGDMNDMLTPPSDGQNNRI